MGGEFFLVGGGGGCLWPTVLLSSVSRVRPIGFGPAFGQGTPFAAGAGRQFFVFFFLADTVTPLVAGKPAALAGAVPVAKRTWVACPPPPCSGVGAATPLPLALTIPVGPFLWGGAAWGCLAVPPGNRNAEPLTFFFSRVNRGRVRPIHWRTTFRFQPRCPPPLVPVRRGGRRFAGSMATSTRKSAPPAPPGPPPAINQLGTARFFLSLCEFFAHGACGLPRKHQIVLGEPWPNSC